VKGMQKQDSLISGTLSLEYKTRCLIADPVKRGFAAGFIRVLG